MKLLLSILAALAAASLLVGLTGCGEGSGATTAPSIFIPRKFDVSVDNYPNAQTVGLLMAEQRRYFQKAGLNVWLRLPVSRLNPLRYTMEGQVAFGISHEPQVMMAREKGAPIVAFGSVISEPTASLIWLKRSKIRGLADLKGRTIAIVGLPFERSFLGTILARAGLTLEDVKVVRADYDLLPALTGGRADAIVGSWNLEGARLRAQGLEPVVTRVQDLGIPSYDELVLISRSDRLGDEPRAIRRFMAAVARGTEAALEDPEAAAKLLARRKGESVSPALEAEVKATLPLLSRTARLDPQQADDLIGWMQEQGFVQEELPAEEVLTNDFLPPSG